jgi:hypothetical protein
VEIAANRAGINGGANEHAAKTITVTVTDLNDEAPTDIQINDTLFINGKVVFTLSAVASGDGNMHITNSCDGTVGSEFVIIDDFKKSVGGPPEITNTDVSVVENSSTDTPLLTIAHGSTDKSIQYGISGSLLLTILKSELVVVKVMAAAAVSISAALRVPSKKLAPLSLVKTTLSSIKTE